MLLLFIELVGAQTPNHFILGEEQFSKVDIYDIYEDAHYNLHLASNDGIYVFKQNKFQKYPRHPKQKGNSFFDFKINADGYLFCKNLNGQLFSLVNGRLILVYQLSSHYNGKFHYFFDSNNELNILNSQFYRINSKKKKVILNDPNLGLKKQPRNFVNPSIGMDSTVLCKYLSNGELTYMHYKNYSMSTIDPDSVIWKNQRQNDAHAKVFIYNLGEHLIFFGKDSTIGKLDANIQLDMEMSYNEIVKPLKKDLLIGMHRSRGYRLIYLQNDTLKASPYYLTNTFISSAFLNGEGTLYLGTFNKGVIVIPDYTVISYISDNQFRGIAVTPANELYLSSRDGKIIRFDRKLATIRHSQSHNDHLFYVDYPYYTKDSTNILTDDQPKIATIKDTYETNNGLYLATNSGIYFISQKQNKKPGYFTQKKEENRSIYNSLEKFTTIAFDTIHGDLYGANFKGTYKINKNGETTKLKKNGLEILTTDIEIYKDNIILGTEQDGILIFASDQLKKQLSTKNKLRSNGVKKIKLKNQYLYILYNNGIQVIDLETEYVHDIGWPEGIRTNHIANFDLSEDRLWIVENDRFYSVAFVDLFDSVQDLNFSIDSIMVNNSVIHFPSNTAFGHNEHAFSFYVDYSNLLHLEEAYYSYQLIGFDKEQSIIPVTQNVITYQSLPPGEYSFKIQLHYRNQESEPYHYNFKILAPFWQRWWFYALILLIFGAIIFFISQYELKRQAKEAIRRDELNSSKLIAIQSQMNPHFVFNALNSIQHLVMLGDKDQSYTHITSFANLVRQTLEFSEQETISVAEEIQLLKVYLSLEKLRFQGDFEYEFKYANLPNIQVPPMLIQPFIENALIHGLMHKKGQKRLTISLEVRDVLICKIEDNGIGREAVELIKKRQMDNHKSFAVNAIDNRLKILRSYHKETIGYAFEDFQPDDSQSVVTRLTLRIPIKLRCNEINKP